MEAMLIVHTRKSWVLRLALGYSEAYSRLYRPGGAYIEHFGHALAAGGLSISEKHIGFRGRAFTPLYRRIWAGGGTMTRAMGMALVRGLT